jgi:hypothetical protein
VRPSGPCAVHCTRGTPSLAGEGDEEIVAAVPTASAREAVGW